MKKYILSTLLAIIVFNLSAQVITQKTDASIINEKIKLEDKSNIDVLNMPSFDLKELLEEDEINKGLDLPYRFGYAFEVDYNMQNVGTWTEVKSGKVWSLKIVSKGAYSINLAYSKFYLPENSQLYIYNEQKTVLQGPFTSENNTTDGTFSSDLIESSAIILEYFEPDNVKEKPEILISKVVHAYRNLFPNSTKGYGSSGSCNIDVNCPEGDVWQDESNAVAMILVGSDRICSGCMVNNTNQDFTPYFLTANHCISGQNVNDWSFRFQYKSPSCNGGDDYSYYSYHGADLEANSSVSDFALLELDTRPNANTGITYAGWSISTIAPNSAVGIHHPSGDVMKISFDDDNLTKTTYPSLSGNNHWKVIFDEGTAEHGSSGSPIFDPDHRIIGQLHGGYPGCSSNKNFWYGSFDVSWTHGLSAFLDPNNTGAMTTNTVEIPYVSGTGTICSSNRTFTLHNLPSGSTVTWTRSNNLTYVSGQGTNNYTVKASNSSTSGQGWVQANINVATFRKTFWVGKPKFTISGTDELMPRQPGMAIIQYSNDRFIQGVSNVNWSYTGPLDYINGDITKARYKAGNSSGLGFIYALATNTCGQRENRMFYEISGWHKAYPNPVKDILTIEIDKSEMPKRLISKKIEILLYDKMMSLKKKTSFSGTFTTPKHIKTP
ncbi:MAG: trypsin-like peptidase domain-containing protein [Bacteroidota bacterium]|nr:trypsin-like peptidase domain-containing protein [Bacteroidota bacterium]